MSQLAPPNPDGTPPETARLAASSSGTTTSTSTPTPPAPRRGIFRWILIPLLMVGMGFVGYRLGQTGSTSSSTQGRFSGQGAGGQSFGGQSSGGQASGRSGSGQSAGQAGAGSGAGSTGRSQGAAGGTSASTRSGGGANAAGGTAAGISGGGIVTPVQASAVQAGTLSTERRLTGTVSAAQTANVNAQTSGTVTTLLKNVGDSVGAGQTVLTLSNKDLSTSLQSAQNTLETAQAQLESQQAQMDAGTASLQQAITTAQASLTNAQNSYDSMQKLYAVGAVAKATLDAQEVQVQSARNSLVSAQTNLATNTRSNNAALTTARLNVQKAQIALSQARDAASSANVVAPFDGQITAMNVTTGQFLNSSTAAFTVVSNTQQVKVNIPSTEARSLPVGAAMTFVVGQQKYPLKVTQNAGGTSGSVPITAKFTEAHAPQGTVGSVVYTAKVASGILVPSTALQVDGSTTYVFTVENNKAKQHTVTVLGQAGTQSAVTGIDAGAEVVTQPPTGLLDGGSVTTSTSARAGSSQDAGNPPPGGMP